MFNHKEFLASQADRQSQLEYAAQYNAAQAARTDQRLGPVFGPLLARVGDGMIAVGTRLQKRYAALQERESCEPVTPLRTLAP